MRGKAPGYLVYRWQGAESDPLCNHPWKSSKADCSLVMGSRQDQTWSALVPRPFESIAPDRNSSSIQISLARQMTTRNQNAKSSRFLPSSPVIRSQELAWYHTVTDRYRPLFLVSHFIRLFFVVDNHSASLVVCDNEETKLAEHELVATVCYL